MGLHATFLGHNRNQRGVSKMYGFEHILMSFMAGISVGAVLVLISVR